MVKELSNQIADLVASVSPSVVQVEGQGRPATGLVYAEDIVVTTARAVGRDEHPRVRRHDGEVPQTPGLSPSHSDSPST